ncbi:unnamed protein product [Caenorhabditis angaria]|uniref:THAP-type domain-containing protein n=1 Tax=Caenorhabditis angaria TaxID=860376 RepID=A0A9P1I6Z5_9PELO|nr:unnamed protein product [Caenorhabditis angaria]
MPPIFDFPSKKADFPQMTNQPTANGNQNRRKRSKPPNLRCLYCQKLLRRNDLTHVPMNPAIREIWIEILGQQFAANLERNTNGSICRSHFKGGFKFRKHNQFPVAMGEEEENEDEEEEDDDNEIEVLGITQRYSDLLRHVPKKEKEDYPVVIFQKNVKPEINGESEDMDLEEDEIVVVGDLLSPKDEDLDVFEVVEVMDDDREFCCRICEQKTHVSAMKKIPNKTDSFLKWSRAIGKQFAENVHRNPSPHFICKVHLGDIVDKIKKLKNSPCTEQQKSRNSIYFRAKLVVVIENYKNAEEF